MVTTTASPQADALMARRAKLVAVLPPALRAYEQKIDATSDQMWEAYERGDRDDAVHLCKEVARLIGLRSPVTVETMERAAGLMFRSAPARGGFYDSPEWRTVRYQALLKHGNRCQCCGMGLDDGATIHVDHIKPRSKFPELQFDVNNLQVLCEDCNLGKSNTDDTDWRG